MAVAECLYRLAPEAERMLRTPAGQIDGLLWQIPAALSALGSCFEVAAHMPQLSSTAAFKLGAACSFIFGPGQLLVEYLTRIVAADATPGLSQQLVQAVSLQLIAVNRALGKVLPPHRQPQAAAAFARSTAKPSVLLMWLATLTRAAQMVLLSDPEPGGLGTCLPAFEANEGMAVVWQLSTPLSVRVPLQWSASWLAQPTPAWCIIC